MKQPKPFDIVQSKAGHDMGKCFVVIGVEADKLLLCDGKNRRMENPKFKSPKHVRFVEEQEAAPKTDKEIRLTLALSAQLAAMKEEELLGKR